MGEICCVCNKSCGIPPYSEEVYGGIIDGKDYCALCYVKKIMEKDKKNAV